MRLDRAKDVGRHASASWVASIVVLVGAFLAASSSEVTWGGAGSVVAFVVPAAALCLVTSLVVMGRAWRENNAELGVFAAFFLTMSLLPLHHGITIPGPIYGENSASTLTGVMALPIAVLVGWPLLAPRSSAAAVLGRHWRPWVLGWSVLLTVGCGLLFAWPSLAPAVDPASRPVVVMALMSGSAIVWMSLMHLRLYRLSGHLGSMIASIGFLVLGASALGWLPTEPNSAAFWLAHGMDVAGVGSATLAAIFAYRQRADLQDVLAPIVDLDPLRALEIGLDPTVHAFVTRLGQKDRITRDHVVRVGRLASEVGLRLRLDTHRLPALAVAAVLHDIGKLDIPSSILDKPGRLEAHEYEIMKTHAASGASLLERSPALAPAAEFVRCHHERPDGGGYPRGLHHAEIPVEALIIGACDAFDAIANTRQYREGKGAEFAVSVLREHSGSQFDPVVVRVLQETIAETEDVVGLDPTAAFSLVGSTADRAEAADVACADCAELVEAVVES